MKNKNQTVFVQLLAFITAALSVIFLRQYYQGKSNLKFKHAEQELLSLTHSPKILLETAEVKLSDEIVITPIES